MPENTINKIEWLKLRISFYPNPVQRKLLIAYGHVNGTRKTETVELIVRKYFLEKSQNEINRLITLYDNDPYGEIKKIEKCKYIESKTNLQTQIIKP